MYQYPKNRLELHEHLLLNINELVIDLLFELLPFH